MLLLCSKLRNYFSFTTVKTKSSVSANTFTPYSVHSQLLGFLLVLWPFNTQQAPALTAAISSAWKAWITPHSNAQTSPHKLIILNRKQTLFPAFYIPLNWSLFFCNSILHCLSYYIFTCVIYYMFIFTVSLLLIECKLKRQGPCLFCSLLYPKHLEQCLAHGRWSTKILIG